MMRHNGRRSKKEEGLGLIRCLISISIQIQVYWDEIEIVFHNMLLRCECEWWGAEECNMQVCQNEMRVRVFSILQYFLTQSENWVIHGNRIDRN